jgi:asparagine synthase (glutamine-hydrolysing)
MSEAVAHRGPDDSGTWAEGPAVLTQRRMRLSEAGRRQPIAANPLTLVLDGRIYDLGALRNALDREGVTPRTTGDADAVLAAWSLWGPDTLDRIQGDFSLAVWDRRERVLWLARDPMGVKPLYFSHQDGRFAFASDLRALLGLPWVSRELATEELAEYLSFRYCHAPRTLLRQVRQLPAGHLARVDGHGLRLHRFWRPEWCPPDAQELDEDAVRDGLERLLDRSTEKRLVADRPVGILLSGGLGSAGILQVASRRETRRTLNVSFADGGMDEASYAGRVAGIYGAHHETLRISREDFVEALPTVVEAAGQPLPSPSAVIQFLTARFAREQGMRILLSGDGGDELLGGRRVARLVRELRAARLGSHLPTPARRVLRSALSPFGRGAALEDPEHFGLARKVGGSAVFQVGGRMELLRDPAQARPGVRRTMLEPFYNEVETDPINQVLHVYQRGWLPEDSLMRSDRAAMAVGVEMRYPLLDAALVRWLAGLPGFAKIKRRRGQWQGKWPLARMLEDKLPEQVLWRPKRGMPSPMNRWLRGEGEGFLWHHVEQICEDPHGLFQADTIRAMAREHAAGEAEHGPKIWTLIFLDLWLRTL